MPKRKFLQVPIITREDERAIERVSKALRRNKADAARFLFHEADKKLKIPTNNSTNGELQGCPEQ